MHRFSRVLCPGLLLAAATCLAPASGAGQSTAPTTAIRAGRWTYAAHAELGEQRQDIGPRTVTVSDTTLSGAHAWLVVMRMAFDGHETADTVAFRSDDLRPVLRFVSMGDAKVMISVEARDSMARGLLIQGHDIVPLNVPLGARSFLNYYALRAALPALPLAAGWVGTAETLELGGRPSFTPLRLAVEGEERLTVPAGSFDCWLLHVTGAAGIDERYWVTKNGHDVVRAREPIGGRGAVMQLDLTELTLALPR